ncbi:MAG TPA: AMIN domain-containing protein, partial [Burkholderiaceae bacterium]|nr:AMIN domain-containing protein [Burkholderiaceae bacterium]
MNHIEEKASMPGRRAYRAALAVVCGLPMLAWAEPAIQAIQGTQQSTGETIRIELTEPLAGLPKGFVLQTPPRIALDLPGVGNATGRSSQEMNLGNLRSVAMAQAGDRTRLVFNLKQATQYKAELQGKALVVTLDPVPMAAPAGAATVTA